LLTHLQLARFGYRIEITLLACVQIFNKANMANENREPLFKWEIDVGMLVLPHGGQPNQGGVEGRQGEGGQGEGGRGKGGQGKGGQGEDGLGEGGWGKGEGGWARAGRVSNRKWAWYYSQR
jgi:hypothetical protein